MRNWIAKATKNKGGLHRQLGIPITKRIPVKVLNKAAKAGGRLGRRARLAKTLAGFRKR